MFRIHFLRRVSSCPSVMVGCELEAACFHIAARILSVETQTSRTSRASAWL